MSLPLVAIVGAPNVGKSTLFNRLIGGRRAIVTDEPGVTRDRLYGEVRDVARPFRLVDTGGLTLEDGAPFSRDIERQTRTALEQARVVLFVVDARAGVTALDQELATMLLRRDARPVLVGNKVDAPDADTRVHELHALGLGRPIEVSAEHGLGIDELMDAIQGRLPSDEVAIDADRSVGVAIVGRPNVGKSSMVNALLGEERVIVGEQPGTTRDAVDTLLEVEGRRYRLVDTAGLRRPGKVRHVLERFSAQRARQNIERCDVAVLVLDGAAEFTAQDAHVAGYVVEALKPMVVAINKWDIVTQREEAVKRWEDVVRSRMCFTKGAPIVFSSALTGQRVLRILDRVDELHRAAGIRVPTQQLNRWLRTHPASSSMSGRRGPGLRLFYLTQTGVHPPSFVLFCNDPARVHFSTRRHIENSLRESFGFGPTPIRLKFRGRREVGQR